MTIYLVKLNWNPWQVTWNKLWTITAPLRTFLVLLVDWLTDWMTDWLTDWLTDWIADWLTDWLADWFTDWLINRPTDWLNDRFTDSLTACEWHFLIDAVWWPQASDPDDKRQPGKKCAHHSFTIIHFTVSNVLIVLFHVWCYNCVKNIQCTFSCLTDYDWLTDWLTHWLTGWLTDWLKVTDWLIDQNFDQLIDWLFNWLINWLTDWLIDLVLNDECVAFL